MEGGATPLTIECGSLAPGTIGVAYSSPMTLYGGTPPYTVEVTSGALPDGLSIDDAGLITGTPTHLGTFTFTVEAQDSASPMGTASVSCSITISGLVTVSCENPPDGTLGLRYYHQLTVDGGEGPYWFSITEGELPPGLTIYDNTGLIPGTPTQAGTFTFTVTVDDSASPPNTASVVCSITINPPAVVLDCSTLPAAVPGVPYSAQLAIVGGTPPYTVTVLSEPTWLSIDDTGAITGTAPLPSAAAVIKLEVQDSASPPATGIATCVIPVQLPQTPQLPCWMMDIADSLGNPLVSSIPLLTGQFPAANILAPWDYLGIGSAFIIKQSGMGSTTDIPDDSNLGTQFLLLWDSGSEGPANPTVVPITNSPNQSLTVALPINGGSITLKLRIYYNGGD